MTVSNIDIVIPVWNRPNETRNCLVSLIHYTQGARFIMIDNGSDRETEKLLQELAEGLDDRALLMRTDTNLGFVGAANRGLARTEAPLLALVRSNTQVTAGWLEPILRFSSTHPEAGILLPRQVEDASPCQDPFEVANSSFDAMVITRKAYQAIGGFDEELDGGAWCLKDFTRRACSKGFYTYLVPTATVRSEEEVVLGSERRRVEALNRSIALFRERWGEGGDFCLHVPKGVDLPVLTQKLACLLKGARHGDRYTVLLPRALYKEALQARVAFQHENIRLVPLPRFATAAAKRRLYKRLVEQFPGLTPVTAVDGIAFPWSEHYLPFTHLSERIGCL